MNEQALAKTALVFLERAPIEGHEAEAMVLCKQWLRKIIQPPPPPFDTAEAPSCQS